VEGAGSGVELAGQHLEGRALAGAVEAKQSEALKSEAGRLVRDEKWSWITLVQPRMLVLLTGYEYAELMSNKGNTTFDSCVVADQDLKLGEFRNIAPKIIEK